MAASAILAEVMVALAILAAVTARSAICAVPMAASAMFASVIVASAILAAVMLASVICASVIVASAMHAAVMVARAICAAVMVASAICAAVICASPMWAVWMAASAMSAEVMAAVSMCAVWIAAIWICKEPTEPFCNAPMPTELIASFEPVIMPLGSWRAEMVFPSSVSATVPSVMAVYLTLQAVVGILRHAHGHLYADARCDDAHAVAEENVLQGLVVWYSSVSAQLIKSTLSVTVGRSQPLSYSACTALRISV